MAQLSLSLDPEAPRLPASVPPMEPVAGDLPHDGERWIADPQWGGVRAIAMAEPGRVGLVDRSGVDIPGAGPLRTALEALAAHRVVLDGVWLSTADAGAALFVAWDLLWRDGRPLLARPLAARRAGLGELPVPAGGALLAPPPLAGELADCLSAVAREGLPGLLVRRRDSAYLPGVRSRLWRTAAPEARVAYPAPRRPILAVLQRLPLGEHPAEDE